MNICSVAVEQQINNVSMFVCVCALILLKCSVVFHHSLCAFCFVFFQMLTVDLSIYASGWDQMDSADSDGLECDSASQLKISADLISQWEAELLQERLQELLHAAAAAPADDDTKTLVRRTNLYLFFYLYSNRWSRLDQELLCRGRCEISRSRTEIRQENTASHT